MSSNKALNKVLFFLFLIVISYPAQALDIETIRFGDHPDKTRIVIETSDKTDFKAFILPNPNRLIVDLPLFVWQAGDMQAVNQAGITSVRHAINKPGISRIVFDLSHSKGIKNAFKLPPLDNGNARIVIDLTKGSLQTAQFGSLETDIKGIPPSEQAKYVPPPAPVAKKPIIVLDAGHGGNDPGAISPQRFFEKNIVLKLTQELKKSLENTGRYKVKLTRDNDTYIRLHDRVKLSRDWNADMFISLHADSIDNGSVRGASVYTLSNKSSDKLAAKLAENENRSDIIAGVDLTHEDRVVADILTSLMMRDTKNQSRFFASVLVDAFKKKGIKTLPNTHRYAGFAVLKAPDVPSVLIEAGFLSNKKEAGLLNQKSYRTKIVGAITYGIDTYFERTRL